MSTSQSSNAALIWQDDGLPFSSTYGDIYFSSADPLGESEYVFLQKNALYQRWSSPDTDDFVIAETGFGSGLNFLCAWRLWEKLSPPAATLHYLACEKHPLKHADMQRIQQRWPALSAFSSALLMQYSSHTAGLHRLTFFGNDRRTIRLSLLYGDATDCLKELYQSSGWRVDAWFLDGFAPHHNPAMWSLELCHAMACLSRPGTTVSTYTVAGDVRRNLGQAGFVVSKQPGYGHKRHMLAGSYAGLQRPALPEPKPWFSLPQTNPDLPKTATVIGAGLAGCATAHALASRGWQVSLLERRVDIAQAASGNPQGIVHLNPGKSLEPADRFRLQAYLYALARYRELAGSAATDSLQWHPCGLLQLACTPRLADKLSALVDAAAYAPEIMRSVNQKEAGALAGTGLKHGGLYFPDAGWLQPNALCRHYASHPNITLHRHREVLELLAGDKGWEIMGHNPAARDGIRLLARSTVIVIANSLDAGQFRQSAHYPLSRNSGQVSFIPVSQDSAALSTILCGEGYLIPAPKRNQDPCHSLGGSFTSTAGQPEVRLEAHRKNLALLADLMPALHATSPLAAIRGGRAALRCSTPDYLPLVGPVEDYERYRADYAALQLNARKALHVAGSCVDNLYINVGHGSHGLTSTPLAAEYLAALINREPLPLPNTLIHCLHPARFLIRDLKRQKLSTACSDNTQLASDLAEEAGEHPG
ncbi:MAG: bifunctional tRNA (5-methylaminomethyl-2-thiouridine)(34)-methyltransferase MnmD/FAD-dependent 5-carboxymethylaminomethyl-2-thiouridine(34) oxidoreductase MnmC [Pseudomonadales bacterium]|nr:bifunctional tRNA (5-methylaminomethyl-2-thiouridine)(34)-methyltransferase MnmD/FAD-dependent 5-carboxymethylaminomethyl-2-thiouridine(34) oxidoreductase MnmC [Pseudomonadales bacterium]